GVRTGGYPKSAPMPGPLGWQRAGDWDFLWAPARLALKALPHVKPGQLVSACPGLMSITKKVGAEAYGTMWKLIQRNSALVMAAALKHIKADHEVLKASSGMTCEVVGLDYLIDEDLHPWLLEVNGTPSLQVEHENPRVEQLIHEQKNGMVQDLMGLLGLRDRFKPRYAALRAAAKSKQQAVAAAAVAAAAAGSGSAASLAAAVAAASAAAAAAPGAAALTRRLREQLLPTSDEAVMARVLQELANAGGFEPLMGLMPLDPQPGLTVPWDARDFELRRLMEAGLDPAASSGSDAGPWAGRRGSPGQPEEPAQGAGGGAGAGGDDASGDEDEEDD
ncbi:hypothetical protein TSOC_000073, partial [Tetrabaena socialis]